MRPTLALLLLATISIRSAAASPAATAIVGATIVDVESGAKRADSVVVIAGDKIVDVFTRGQKQVPRGARVIPASGRWLVPGLTDMHAHVVGAVGPEASEVPLDLYLAKGVTTVRDPGCQVTVARALRAELERGKRRGPRLFFTGNMLDGDPPLWPDMSFIVDTPARAESAVRFLADQGVDAIKVYNGVSEASLVQIVSSARSRGLPVIGHVPRALTTSRAIELGMSGLEHIRVTGRELLPAEEAARLDGLPLARREALLWDRYDLDSPGIARLIQLMVTHKVFLDPTLVVDEVTSYDTFAQDAADPTNRYLTPALRTYWQHEQMPAIFAVPAEMRATSAAGFDKRLRFVGMCARAGVVILTGTDGARLGRLLPGFALHRELALLVKAGLTPLQALQASTLHAARALGYGDRLGTIAPGRFADLLILDADPLLDIQNLQKIRSVVAAGVVLDPDEILAQLERAGR